MWEDVQRVASEDLNLGFGTEIVGSNCRLLAACLVGNTDPGVEFLFTVAGCCNFRANILEFFNVIYVFSTYPDCVSHSCVFPQTLSLLRINHETDSFGPFSKMFCILLGIQVCNGQESDIVSIVLIV